MPKLINALRVIPQGNKKKALSYTPLARKYLFNLAKELSFNNLDGVTRKYTQADGTEISVNIAGGSAKITIISPFITEKEEEKKEKKQVEKAYILVRLRADNRKFIVWETDTVYKEYPPLFPSIPVIDKCFVYDVVAKEVNEDIGFAEYNSDAVKKFLETHRESVTTDLWEANIAGQVNSEGVNPDGTADTRLYQNIPDSLLYDVETKVDMLTPEGLAPMAGTDITDIKNVTWDDDGFEQGAEMTKTAIYNQYVYSDMWVGDLMFGQANPISFRLKYLGNGEPFYTSFQVKYFLENGKEGDWVRNGVCWNAVFPRRTRYVINTAIGELASYVINGVLRFYHRYRIYDGAHHGQKLVPLPPYYEDIADEVDFDYIDTSTFYLGPDLLPGYPFYPPWHIDRRNFNPTHNVYTDGWYSEVGEELCNYKQKAVCIYDKADKEQNPSGSKIMSQVYICQARKDVTDQYGHILPYGFNDFDTGTEYLHWINLGEFGGVISDLLLEESLNYKDYVPSEGSTIIRTPDGDLPLISNPDGNNDEEEKILTEAESLGFGVIAASDLYEDASLADPRKQIADPNLTKSILKLWVLTYDKEYMEAPWEYEDEYQTYVRINWKHCPPFRLAVHHFEPIKEGEE